MRSRQRSDRRGLVSGVVVHDDVDVQPLRDTPVDLLQEVEELPGPVAPVALADDAARGDIEGCEQRGRAVTLVVVCAALRHARQHRQDRLCAIECLDLALFVDTEPSWPISPGALGSCIGDQVKTGSRARTCS